MLLTRYGEDASRKFRRRGVYVAILLAAAVFAIAYAFIGWRRAEAAGLCAAVAYSIVQLRWSSEKRLLVAAAMTLAWTLQVLCLFLLPSAFLHPVWSLPAWVLVVYAVDERLVALLSQI